MNCGTLDNGRITVVIPTYNRAALLPRAIDSALRQTAVRQCDIVVVDDGSTDETPRRIAAHRDRILYVRQARGGVSRARNRAVQTSPNEFAAFLDADDVWEPDKLEQQLAVLSRWPQVVLVAGQALYRRPDGTRWPCKRPPIALGQPIDLAPSLFEGNCLTTSTVLVRTRMFMEAGLFHAGLRRCEDLHAWVRLACRGPCVYLDAALATYQVGTAGGLSSDSRGLLTEQLRVRYLLRRELRRRPDCRPNWHRGLVRTLSALRDAAYRQGDFATAARYGLRCLLHRPWQRAGWEWARALEALARATGGARAGAAPSAAGRRMARTPVGGLRGESGR